MRGDEPLPYWFRCAKSSSATAEPSSTAKSLMVFGIPNDVSLGWSLKMLGNQRFIKPSEIEDRTWKEALKDFRWEVEVDVTGENSDKQAALATLSTVLQTIAGLGGQPMPEEMKPVFNKILSLTGAMSPIEIVESTPVTPAQPIEQPAEVPVIE